MSKINSKELILKIIKKHLGFKKDTDFALFLEIKPQTLSSWYTRDTMDYDLVYAKCGFLNADWLLTGQGEMLKTNQPPKAVAQPQPANKKGIPLLPLEAFAGIGDSTVQGINFDTIEERYIVPLFDGIKIDFMIPVRGSSMYPKYSSGDVVACRLINELLFIQWNKVYVIDSISQGVIMKRLLKGETPEQVICKSDNKEYGEFNVPLTDVRSIALVVGVIRLE